MSGTAAPGERFYERAVQLRSEWTADPAPAWDALTANERHGWDWVSGMPNTNPSEHCFCAHGPRRVRWSDHLHAWGHTDGYPCPSLADRRAPETAEAVLF